MDPILVALAAQHAEHADLLVGLDDVDWARPSRCDGWSVADVVLHLAQTDEMALGSATGRFAEVLARLTEGSGPAGTVDEGADAMVGRERGQPGDAVRDRWQSGADALVGVLAAADPHDRVTWVAGPLSIRTLTTTRLAETWVHTGDVAAAFGKELAPTDRLEHIARLAWRTVPYAFARAGRALAGPVAFELHGPSGDDWSFVPEQPPVTTIRGDAGELCLLATQRVRPAGTGLRGDGPDADAVLDLVRTYA
jgi:uncharacterized protein (TIGR03084 family)